MEDYSDLRVLVTDELIENAVTMEGNPVWETFWLRIRVPPLRTVCELCYEAEGDRRVDSYKYCTPCADYVEKMAYCTDCHMYQSCLYPNTTCYSCHMSYFENT